MDVKGRLKKIRKGLKQYVVDSTAMLVVGTPIFAGLETIVLDMSNEVSANTRLLAAGLSYVGLGYAVAKGRDKSREIMKIDETASEKKQHFHDAVYSGAFNMVVTPAFYYAAGSRDMTEIIGGTAISIGFGLASGGIVGYVMDNYRDFTGIKESKRVPDAIKNKSPRFKLGLAAAATAFSIALTCGTYIAQPNNTNAKKEEFKKARYSTDIPQKK